MCGLVGVAGNIFKRDMTFFEEALWADSLRGMHSTGVARLNWEGKTSIIKVTGSAPFLMWEKEAEMKKVSMSDRVLLGHNRHATIGEVTERNAHPFEFERVVGAHNGTLRGRSDSKLDRYKSFGTDSEALYFNINEYGVENVIPEVEGAWALTWIDKEKRTLNFLRNSERPLSYAFSKDGQRIYWASEALMLRWLLSRNGVEIHESGILRLTEDTHVSWTIPNSNTAFGEPEVKELRGYKYESPFAGFRDTLNKWGPKHIPQLPAPSGPSSTVPTTSTESRAKLSVIDSSKKNSSDAPPNVVVEKPDSKPEQANFRGNLDPFIKEAERRGREAGREGKSIKTNPHPPMSLLGQAWERGRRAGFDDKKVTDQMDKMYPTSKSLAGALSNGELIKGYNREYISEKIWKARTKGCCSWCGNPTEFLDMHEAQWVDKNNFICEPCITQDKNVQALGLEPLKRAS